MNKEDRKRLVGTKTLALGTKGSVHLEIEVFYEHGGLESKGSRKRGYYLLVVPFTLDKDGNKVYEVTSGAIKRIDSAERFSPKKLKEIIPDKKEVNWMLRHVEEKFKRQLKRRQ